MVNWGILGLGNMGNKFATAIKEIDNAKLISVASLDKSRLNKFQKDHEIKKENCFNNYNQILESKNIDAIYISSLNNTHFDLVMKAIEQKKHILCEKPMSIDSIEAKTIFNELKKTNILFSEAFAYRTHPQSKTLYNLIKKNIIGKINKVEISFGFEAKREDPNSRLFKKEFGGGSILDVGCYTSSLCLFIVNAIGTDDIAKFKINNIKGSFASTGVDSSAYANLIFNEDLMMDIKCSVKQDMLNNCIIVGSKGKLIVPSPWLPEIKSYIEIHIGQDYYKKFTTSKFSIYANQIYSFSNKILNNDGENSDLLMTYKESLINMKIIDKWIEGIN